MTITVLENVDRVAMTDPNDVRTFIEGEILELRPEHEQHLIDLGIAEPAISANADTSHALEGVMIDDEHAKLQAEIQAMSDEHKAALAAAVEELAAEKLKAPVTAE